ncbi:MAG: hypothetical protein Q7R98_01790 [Candidatus Jorgensenbacteria bacterium]|nr:hypothetical protein [Candidatus Jorgensenbacteria bacterium]
MTSPEIPNGTHEVELSEKERLELEAKEHYLLSENCAVVAYSELTGNVPKERIEKIYEKLGRYLENSVRRGAVWFGNWDIRTGNPVQSILDYIKKLKNFIEETKLEAERVDRITPEEIEKMKKSSYRSSVDGKYYNITSENWKYNIFAGKKENYEVMIGEAYTTLEEFGKTALEAGDNETYNLVQEALKELA